MHILPFQLLIYFHIKEYGFPLSTTASDRYIGVYILAKIYWDERFSSTVPINHIGATVG